MRDEGYIKYQCLWTEVEWPESFTFSSLVQFRNQMHDKGFIGVYEDGIGFGNVSQRWDEDQFIISGSSTGSIAEATQDQFSLVTNFVIENNELLCKGPVKASSEALSHAAIYQSQPLVDVVLHIHHFSAWNKYMYDLPTTDPSAAYGTIEMAESIQQLLIKKENRDQGIIIMAGHEEGILIFGENVEDCSIKLKEIVS